jgi:purine-nucleoside phosphorylase
MSHISFETYLHSADWIQNRINGTPEFGIVLGTGLGDLIQETRILCTMDYREIPNFPIATAESHAGKLHFVEWKGKTGLIAQGRFHYYEGYSMQQVVFPVRVMKLLGINLLLLSNISGAINPAYQLADLVCIEDHINLQPSNPLIGRNLDQFGPRWPDMLHAYDPELRKKAMKFAEESGIRIHSGIYASVPGPNLETPAEYRYLSRIGADCVGMSTVPEVIAARHAGMKVFALSAISDLCYGSIKEASVENLLQAAAESQPKITSIFRRLIAEDFEHPV